MDTVLAILHVLQIIILTYFSGASLYLMVFAIAGIFKRRDRVFPVTRKRHISIVVPAFMEDPVIIEGIRSALNQDYPLSSFTVILVADSFREETLRELRLLP